jgi:hypothetical protein
MNKYPEPLSLRKVKALPLSQRDSLSSLEKILIDPAQAPASFPAGQLGSLDSCAKAIRNARARGASVMLTYGAHLIKNGALRLVIELLEKGWLTHLSTNGAGTIHDWELAFQGRTEESVRKNVATGTFGTWDETGRYIHLAVLAGALRSEGYGRSLGRLIVENGVTLPTVSDLQDMIRGEPANPLTPARADLLQTMLNQNVPAGRIEVPHRFPQTSILARAFSANIPFTVHPGIGYDIIANHPIFNGAALGRAGALDFAMFGRAVENLDGGVVLSVGSAIMGPQVFEKSISCVNNLRLQEGRPIVKDHSIFVVDIQDGGNWDWSKGEPAKDNPAYYLRFCKSYARMGGTMQYLECDNVAFLQNLLFRLKNGGRALE